MPVDETRAYPLLIASGGFADYTAAALVANSGWKRAILALFDDACGAAATSTGSRSHRRESRRRPWSLGGSDRRRGQLAEARRSGP
ncbi:MAG: hypothetical protein ACREOL_04390, partial [Candidatus Dormibacteria bacterium]